MAVRVKALRKVTRNHKATSTTNAGKPNAKPTKEYTSSEDEHVKPQQKKMLQLLSIHLSEKDKQRQLCCRFIENRVTVDRAYEERDRRRTAAVADPAPCWSIHRPPTGEKERSS
ncbi:hypothetical protein MRB53_014409 [Persea americana]|uniref:Uncharacterized protein n=1 Tax=Persea americana TaxID=3435 RepID=A0ACC2KBD4_PERAE|nr:hypothetical protein MRB53_014409 [Persea americana]